MLDLLKKLTEAAGVSGNEDRVREIILEAIDPLADKVEVDSMGNIIAYKKGKSSEKKFMVCAHMDEVGFIITKIEENGMLRFAPIGSIDSRILPSKKVRVGKEGVLGVLGIKAIHLQEPSERMTAVKAKQMYIDIGAKNKEDASSLVSIGDYVIFDSDFRSFGDGKIKAKALDDRLGCYSLIEILKEDYPYDLYACFSVQEEIGLRGARILGYRVEADMAIILEGTTCSDVPGVDPHRHTTRLGKGPAVSIADMASIGNKTMVKALMETAKTNNIPFQIKEGISGGNDGGAIQQARGGTMTAVVSVPCRYIHSPSSVADINDIKNTVKLVKEFIRGSDRL